MAQLPGFNCPPTTTQPEKIEYFKPGQVLYPDYACTDTLIVMDADGLNRDIKAIEQGLIDATDDEIDSILHLYCIIKY